MRKTGPVTHREFVIPDDCPLVSTTDIKSRITYCNPAFVAASGYTTEELLGQPHNLIRHPDMPAEAFRDMWATLESGRPWTALVKNRRKNGDHYWVRANVTPVLEDGRIAGYMSVRTKPGRDEVAAAEALYTRMRDEASAGRVRTRLAQGRLIPSGPAGWWVRLAEWRSLAGTAACVMGACAATNAAAMAGPAWAGWLAAALSAIFCATWIWSRDQSVLTRAAGIAERLAAGDLQPVVARESTGSLGRLQRALAQLNVNLQAVVGDVRREVEGVHVACNEIASAGRDLGRRTEAQSGSLQEAASALEQIASTVRHTADGATQARELAGSTIDAARHSGEASATAGQRMQDLRQASERIAEIVGVIEGISFRTNLLALNAAVEAARAGDSGRGFAVVAGEVRALAHRVGEAAHEIKALVGQSREKVDDGVLIVDKTVQAARKAELAVDEMSAMIGRIGDAVTQQSVGVSQVNTSVAEIDTLTQQNAAMVEELGASAASLAQQADTVVQAVRVFKLPRQTMAVA